MSSWKVMSKLFSWLMNLMQGMGDALIHPYRNNQPPQIGFQPFTGQKYRNKRIAI
tara:strand:+ start:370 stop:534 length:165 start_codon:yes stop_codon:yes gene_type:complete